jgi:hypothetical protein
MSVSFTPLGDRVVVTPKPKDEMTSSGIVLPDTASEKPPGGLLMRDALRPWRYQGWIFPRDPHLLELAGPVLDLYACRWAGPAAVGR